MKGVLKGASGVRRVRGSAWVGASLSLNNILFCAYGCFAFVCVCVRCVSSALRGQRRAFHLLQSELQTIGICHVCAES